MIAHFIKTFFKSVMFTKQKCYSISQWKLSMGRTFYNNLIANLGLSVIWKRYFSTHLKKTDVELRKYYLTHLVVQALALCQCIFIPSYKFSINSIRVSFMFHSLYFIVKLDAILPSSSSISNETKICQSCYFKASGFKYTYV